MIPLLSPLRPLGANLVPRIRRYRFCGRYHAPLCQIFCWTFFLTFSSASAFAKDQAKNPYPGQSGSTVKAGQKKQKVLYTTEKKKPSKAERRAVLEDSRIPQNQWKDYTVEYRIPIGFGGSNAYANIEALPTEQARIKHKVQKELEAKLKRKEIGLYDAQRSILNWSQEPTAKKSLPSSTRVQ